MAGATPPADGGVMPAGAEADGGASGGPVTGVPGLIGVPGVPGLPGVPPLPTPSSEGPEQDSSAKRIPKGRGRLEGTVVDATNGEPLIEAQVSVVGLKKRALTDIDGNYSLTLPPGTYALRVWAELRNPKRIDRVQVDLGKATRIDVTLGADEKKITVQEVVVVAQPDRATEAVQLVRRQKSATVSDGVSAEQLQRTPDTNASEAVKRVVGATIQDGKYVVVRGLGGRYSSALLNGVPIPSPDPDLPSAPLDLFPASLLANLNVAKTFTPDMPGNFAGGALMIETRDFPSKFTLKLRLGTGGDSNATFQKAYTYDGSKLDFLGYDAGKRSLPSEVPRDRPVTEAVFPERLDRNRIGAAFPNNWDLSRRTSLPDLRLGVTMGDSLFLANRRFGYLASANFSHRYTLRREHTQRLGEPRGDGTYTKSPEQLDAEVGTEVANVGTLLNIGFMPSPNHRLGFVSMYVHNTENSATRQRGRENNDNVIDRYRLRFLQRQMAMAQLNGEDSFGAGRLVLAWQGNTAITRQDEPDTRDLYRSERNGAFVIGTNQGNADRTFGALREISGGGGLDATLSFVPFKLKAGGSALLSSRRSRVRRFHYDVSERLGAQSNRNVFAQLNNGVEFNEITLPIDAFDADRNVFGGYAMADLLALDPVRVIAGVRYEVQTLSLVTGGSLGVPETDFLRLSRTNKSILPALNAVWAVNARSNLRTAYSITVARPHLRELAPTPFYDYVRRRVLYGDPNLDQTSIHNADLRWESFLEGNGVLAASVFFKHFRDPIERIILSTGGDGDSTTWRNEKSANVYGVEFEGRISGSRLSRSLAPLYAGANLALINSKVTQKQRPNQVGTTDRALQGQSPYVANLELGWSRETSRTQVSLLYNVLGARIFEVGTAGSPDVYEQPIHRLDLNVNQGLGHGLALKMSALNLLAQRSRLRQGGTDILAYDIGVGFLINLEWSMENRKGMK